LRLLWRRLLRLSINQSGNLVDWNTLLKEKLDYSKFLRLDTLRGGLTLKIISTVGKGYTEQIEVIGLPKLLEDWLEVLVQELTE
jgi:hypothetical protein